MTDGSETMALTYIHVPGNSGTEPQQWTKHSSLTAQEGRLKSTYVFHFHSRLEGEFDVIQGDQNLCKIGRGRGSHNDAVLEENPQTNLDVCGEFTSQSCGWPPATPSRLSQLKSPQEFAPWMQPQSSDSGGSLNLNEQGKGFGMFYISLSVEVVA